ncbi:MAG: chromosomal replication initiator protein DnaA [Patescibacteria group bacterium]|nr:chromosomal replication initiator protein DnaA [Patescibacteria group bacterium]
MNNDQLWQAVLGEIELNLSKANFTTWFKNTFISEINNEQCIVCVPNSFTQTWLDNKYTKQIIEAINNISDKKVTKIIYKIETRKNSPVVDLLKKIKIKKEDGVEAPMNRFGLNNRYVFSNFIVGKGNELAHAACQAVSANPGNAYNPLFIYGGVGLGKTHLIQAIGHEVAKQNVKILYTSCENFINDYVNSVKSGKAKEFKDRYREIDCLLVDDIQFMAGKDGTQQEFFHTFNELHQADKQIILTSDRQPKSIPSLEKRLLSRFEWGMIADITPPDTETKVAILNSKCREKNYNLEDEILYYIAENMKNNIRELEGALNRLIAYHEFNNSQPSLDTTKSVLNSLFSSIKLKSITSRQVMQLVAKYYDLSEKDLIGKSRKKELVYPRQISMYLMRKELNTSYPTIGQELGGRDHTTAMHAYKKIKKDVDKNERIKQDIESIKQTLYTCV